MKFNHIIGLFFALFCCSTLSAQVQKDTVRVWGNCGMCQKTIVTAAKSAGASEANWDTETKILTVSYASATNLSKIEQSVAAAGYDTRHFSGSTEAYKKLHGCCQYDRKSTTAKDKMTAECCKNGSCEKSSTCATCEKCKEGKCSTCCKDGKCAEGKDCCKM
jgi:hypothetical protein